MGRESGEGCAATRGSTRLKPAGTVSQQGRGGAAKDPSKCFGRHIAAEYAPYVRHAERPRGLAGDSGHYAPTPFGRDRAAHSRNGGVRHAHRGGAATGNKKLLGYAVGSRGAPARGDSESTRKGVGPIVVGKPCATSELRDAGAEGATRGRGLWRRAAHYIAGELGRKCAPPDLGDLVRLRDGPARLVTDDRKGARAAARHLAGEAPDQSPNL